MLSSGGSSDVLIEHYFFLNYGTSPLPVKMTRHLEEETEYLGLVIREKIEQSSLASKQI